MINYNHMYYFYVTAKLGGVSTAATYLNISQPSLSSQLKVFESSIEKKLFEKKGRRLQLTSDGQRAYMYAKKIFELAHEFSDSLKTSADQQRRKIRIGVTDQVERPFVADLISPLVREQTRDEEKTFYVSSTSSDRLLEQLRREEIDLLLTNKPIYAEDLEEYASASMPVQLFVSNQILKDLKIRLSRQTHCYDFLNAIPLGLVIPSGKMKLRHETDAFFQEIGTRKNITFESDIISVVGRAILDGAGVGFLPRAYVYEEWKQGLLTSIGPKAGYWKHTLYLLGRKDSREHHDKTIDDIIHAVQKIERL